VALDAVLDRLPSLHGRDRTITRLAGGLTGRAWLVSTTDGRCVVRLPAGGPAAAARERRATEAAHAAGVGPPVLDAADGLLAVGWAEGRPLTPADLRDGAVLDRVAQAVARLHAGPLLGVRLDTVSTVLSYAAAAAAGGRARLPPGHLDLLPGVERVAAALHARPEPPRPIHGDLVPANLVDDGQRVQLVDLEWAADEDPCADLGTLAGEADLDPARTAHLVRAYGGGPDPRREARVRLYALLTLYGWATWAAVRDGEGAAPPKSPGAPVDWRAWAAERGRRARERLADPDLPALLEAAAAG